MFWIVLALQAMAPFIHAHADVLHPGHAHGPHVHQALSGAAAGDAVVHGHHDVTVAVAQGLPSRSDSTARAVPAAALPKPTAIPPVARFAAPGPFASLIPLVPPDHVFPGRQAPPRG